MSHGKKATETELEESAEQALEENLTAQDELVAQLERALQEANSERLRAIADFQNYRRRNEQEKMTFRQLATESLVSDLLPILDNFERTLHHLSEGADADRVAAGIQAVDRQLRAVLESYNLKRIEALGQPFDPILHEAIALEASAEHAEDTVIQEVEPGYRIGDKVIRPARVKVAKGE